MAESKKDLEEFETCVSCGGVIYVFGEFPKNLHRPGMLENTRNVFDLFICILYLDEKFGIKCREIREGKRKKEREYMPIICFRRKVLKC